MNSHDSSRMVCFDHDGECCPEGDAHDMTPLEAARHQASQEKQRITRDYFAQAIRRKR